MLSDLNRKGGQLNRGIMYFLNCTDKKENEIFLKYKEIQMGSVIYYEEGLPNI
jgi:hypothetical protein